MNRCTLLVDGNWLLQSRAAVLMKDFQTDKSELAKEQASTELQELMARSINVVLNRFPIIDNIVMISDGGSWRKQLPIPDSLEDTTYKGNRTQDHEIDWNLIYHVFNKLVNHCRELGITTSTHSNAEGDDWIWYWSRRLNADNINCVIWSSDNDLKQLIQVTEDNSAFTAWYNDRNGLWLPESLNDDNVDVFDFFEQAFSPTGNYYNVLESLTNKSKTVNYIDPNNIILSKIICGDAGDNIKSVIRYKKNNRTYRVSEKEWSKISEALKIKDIYDFISRKEAIAKALTNIKKYAQYGFTYDYVLEMINYNIKLVWLNEAVIPETIILAMNQQEYKQFDIQSIRSNFKTLLEEDNTIKNIFEGF